MPQLHLLSRMYWTAFQVLSRRRLINDNGPQPIQVSELVAYADLMHITDLDDREDLLKLIDNMDQVFLEDAYKKRAAAQKKEAQKAKRSAKRGRRR